MQSIQMPIKQVALTLLVLFATSSSLRANELNHGAAGQQQLYGAGIGAGLASFALGPVGIIPGAIFGLLTGDNAAKQQQVSLLQQQQQSFNAQLELLSKERDATFIELTKLQQRYDSVLAEVAAGSHSAASAEQNSFNLSSQILFRSGKSKLEDHYRTELTSIAKLLHNMPQLQVLIEGHADEKGPVQDNYDLSIARANAVYDFFQQAGITSSRLSVRALGENDPIFNESSLENDSYHRRVHIHISHPMLR